ncbi:hypothetical protein [Dokdonella sp.]|uniref:YybH family protein n=1 Tax=Dokdonella sp. TaxID=2291710 RepID=UPI003527879F
MISMALSGSAACSGPSDPATIARAGIEAQTRAWNSGDLDGAMESYCPSTDITWVNAKGVTRGYKDFAESMQAEFGAEPAMMGVLSNEVIDIRAIGEDSSLVVLDWSIMRDGEKLMGGVSTQLWSACQGRMRIVFEHAS